jgi:hypothetical protein
MSWQWPAGAACGFLIALVTTPAGVSGALLLLLLPVQLSILRVPSPGRDPRGRRARFSTAGPLATALLE